MKITVATVKPFAPMAVKLIRNLTKDVGYEFELLEKYANNSELIEAAKNTDALIVRSDKITREVIEASERLKIIVRAGAGYDNVDLEAASEKGIVVMNTPGQNANAVAELAIGMMVFLARGFFNGKPGTELKERKLGIHAYGNVGKNIAKIAKGFGMKVYAFDPFVKKEYIEKDDVKVIDSIEKLYAKCQYISLNIPANAKTVNSIDYNLLSKMPKDAVLVNTARKEIINEPDILKMMEIRPDFKYLSDLAPNCKEKFEEKFKGRFFFSPKKMGAQTIEANINAGIGAANQIVNFFENNDKTFQVN